MKRLCIGIAVVCALFSLWAGGVEEQQSADPETVYDVHWILGYWGAEIDPAGDFANGISEAVGINLQMEYVPQGQLNQRYQVIFNSGDLPDVITIARPRSAYADWARKGLIIPLDEYWNEYPLLQKNLPKDLLQRSTMVDGKIYGLPVNRIPVNRFIGVRGDWLDKFGMEKPRTLDALKAYAKRVVAEDPDGNGKDDTFALGLDFAFFGANEIFFAPYNAGFNGSDTGTPQLIFDESGGIVPYFLQPGMEEAVMAMSEWYAEGLIDPASISQGNDFHKNTWEAGVYGIGQVVPTQLSRVDGLFKQIDPDAYLTLLDPLGGGGITTTSGWYRFHAVSALVEEPAKVRKILDMFEWLLTEDGQFLVKYGTEGVHWNPSEDGKPILTPLWGFDEGHSWPNYTSTFVPNTPEGPVSADILVSEFGPVLTEAVASYTTNATRSVFLPETPDDLFDQANGANRARNAAVLEMVLGKRPVGDLPAVQRKWLEDGAQAWIDACLRIAEEYGLK